jgi:hypothetical protein
MPFNVGGTIWNGASASVHDYRSIITRGLVMNLDASAPGSYPGSGTTWGNLASGSYSDGTLNGSPTFSTDNGGIFNFDGNDDYIDCGTAIHGVMTSAFSLTMWFQGGASWNNSHMVSTGKMVTVNEPGFWIQGDTYKINVRIRENGNSTSTNCVTSSNYNTNTWHYLAVTYNGSNLRIVIDNFTEDITQSVTGTPGRSRSLKLDKAHDTVHDGSEMFPGKIANFQIYNRALSMSEIKYNYNVQRHRFGI